MEERWYEYWFSCVKGISNARKREIREGILSMKELYNIEETAQILLSDKEIECITSSRVLKNWEEEYKNSLEKGVKLVTCIEPSFPEKLKELKDIPYALFYKGTLPFDGERFPVAIVGARRCTPYGEHMTMRFAEELALRGAVIISGMARGIDGIAHRAALNVGGATCAVLGCGVDICYPSEHRGLYSDIEKKGCILSEFPPGTKPLAHHFPARNRIISGLSDIVLVMEAKEKSGSLITADMALEQGKDIHALPGSIESELSRGCNYLIYQGAGILLSPEEFVNDLIENGHLRDALKSTRDDKNKIKLEREEKLVYSCLDFYPKNKEQILKETMLMPQILNSILVTLELNGYIEERSKNYYVKRR